MPTHARKIVFGLAAASVTLMLGAGQAQAATGSGSFTNGYEIPSERVTFAQGVVCATFHKTNANNQNDPTIHVLPMSGTFGEPGNDTGTATFTINDDWHAGPEGTYTDSNCGDPGGVEGTLHVAFDDWSCADDTDALYTRTSETTYTLTGTVICDDLDTTSVTETTAITVTFSGTQVICNLDCNDPNAGTNLNGTYAWSTP